MYMTVFIFAPKIFTSKICFHILQYKINEYQFCWQLSEKCIYRIQNLKNAYVSQHEFFISHLATKFYEEKAYYTISMNILVVRTVIKGKINSHK